jgi:hypothetical protein
MSAAEDLSPLAPTLGVPDASDRDRTVAQVQAALARRQRWLLVFDNAPNADAVREVVR